MGESIKTYSDGISFLEEKVGKDFPFLALYTLYKILDEAYDISYRSNWDSVLAEISEPMWAAHLEAAIEETKR